MDTFNTIIYASPMAEELVCVLGLPLASKIVKRYKGQNLYIAKNIEKSVLHLHLTTSEVIKVIEAFGGDTLNIPKTITPPKTTTAQIIRLAEQNIKNTGRVQINAIAKETNTTNRWVRMVLAKATDTDTHPTLFDF